MNQNFSLVLVKHAYLNVQRLFHNSSYKSSNHYDTLKLQRNCTTKQIRDSFLKLSKQNHPDINKSPDAHKKFLKIQEAYNVLSKPELRASYDFGLSNLGSRATYGNQTNYNQSSGPRCTYYNNPWHDSSFYHHRNRSKDAFYENTPYYGIKGINRQSNGTVAFVIVVFTLTMFVIQMFAIRRTVSIQQDVMNKRSMEAQKILDRLKEQAERNGNEVQIEIHRKQFEDMERIRAERAEAARVN